MLRNISGRQFTEWMAYYNVEPFGDEWTRTALIASLIANANRDPDVRAEPFMPEEFIPRLTDEEAEDPDAGWKRNKLLLTQLATRKET
jgi:hypothetical protein